MRKISYYWYGGDVLCRVCKFFYTFSFYLNSFVIAGIAIDRACSAYKINSLKAFESANRRVFRTLVAAYAGATIFSIPQIFIFRVFQPLELVDFRQCTPVWTTIAYEYDLRIQLPTTTEREKNMLAAHYMQVSVASRSLVIENIHSMSFSYNVIASNPDSDENFVNVDKEIFQELTNVKHEVVRSHWISIITNEKFLSSV
ncbi:unnamed protein product [Anisakis simplex]|uniref:G_PROTEIN_RECEP_F1_2 domain-containing protein n=1 Tax=Anisakis simplex TaxID=6269 RepID=A0A0M3J8M2_ANISI|nr:unnamed protein product [Anisakis simplex]